MPGGRKGWIMLDRFRENNGPVLGHIGADGHRSTAAPRNRWFVRLGLAICCWIVVGNAVGPAAESAASAADPVPRVFLLDGNSLVRVRTAVLQGDPRFSPALDQLRKDADTAMRQGPFSVVSKSQTPPSGDKHDYMSQGPYWWPNPATPDGLPYVRRDGQVNPEYREYDNVAMGRMESAVTTLAHAYFFTAHEPYAQHAALLLRTWFLDDQTRMNPNLEFGQRVPGQNVGRGTGTIEMRSLPELLDAVGLLAGSAAWTEADQDALIAWFQQYLRWLLESSHGGSAASASNNIGTWFDVQTAGIALFVGRQDIAHDILRTRGPRRIAAQIEPDGRQPHELARTRPSGYSAMNLQAMLSLALLGDHVEVDLWSYRTDDGRSIRAALDYLVRHADGSQPWPYQDMQRPSWTSLIPSLRIAANYYQHAPYEQLATRLGGRLFEQDRIQLLRTSRIPR
jgi:hypothetical protein